jgi:hypothetical protein
MEELDAPTVAMFKRFQGALLTLAREWRDPDLKDPAHAPDSTVHDGHPTQRHPTEATGSPASAEATAVDTGQESAA